jgi:hypothetical protein
LHNGKVLPRTGAELLTNAAMEQLPKVVEQGLEKTKANKEVIKHVTPVVSRVIEKTAEDKVKTVIEKTIDSANDN